MQNGNAGNKTGKNGDERRRHRRHAIVKNVRTRHNSKEHKGQTKDISASGIAIEPHPELVLGDKVEVDIEELGVFTGKVSRSTEENNFFAVSFDTDEYEEDELLSELTRIHDDIASEEF